MTSDRTGRAAPGSPVAGRAPLVVVDGANVVGSVPDGWWRDRRGAAERLRDRLTGHPGPAEVVLVVEGAARGVASVPGVRVVTAPGSGDDRIVELVRDEGGGRPCVVVTADRGLRERVTALGAGVSGPRELLEKISPRDR
ncbi:NYN domain-containing protein [Streptomyces specialis]|uniref:NTP pyrophosphohydrolase n=1 Tax=Streptomyces specialis TaxID=498367 RepID=UPI000ABE06A3|nr:NTP pyrophosphohydrolase [Streptomyces specialis]